MGDVHKSVAVGRPRRNPRKPNSLTTQSGSGTATVIVRDKSTDMVDAIARLSYFYKHVRAVGGARLAGRGQGDCG